MMNCPKCHKEGWVPYSDPTNASGLRWCIVEKRWMHRLGLPTTSLADLVALGILRYG